MPTPSPANVPRVGVVAIIRSANQILRLSGTPFRRTWATNSRIAFASDSSTGWNHSMKSSMVAPLPGSPTRCIWAFWSRGTPNGRRSCRARSPSLGSCSSRPWVHLPTHIPTMEVRCACPSPALTFASRRCCRGPLVSPGRRRIDTAASDLGCLQSRRDPGTPSSWPQMGSVTVPALTIPRRSSPGHPRE